MAYTGSYGTANNEIKLGIWYRTTDNGSTYKVEIEIWLNTGTRNIEDSSNEFYFDRNATSATTYKCGFNIDMTSKKEIKLATYTYTYTKTKSAQKINCAAKLLCIGSDDRSVSVTNSFTVPALSTYAVKYDANGGTGAPSSQTKTYGVKLTLSSVVPTRSGYMFKGWGTSAGDTTVDYSPGGSYTANAAITLYAIWELQANCYIKHNGAYAPGMLYIKDNGTYKLCSAFVKENGTYKRCDLF